MLPGVAGSYSLCAGRLWREAWSLSPKGGVGRGAMGEKIEVKIEGGEKLLRQLRRMGMDVEQVLEAAVMAGAEIIAAEAGKRAPKPMIETKVTNRSNQSVEVSIGPPEEKWYWRFLETGAQPHVIRGAPLAFEGDDGLIITWAVQHPGIAAKPFLRPAVDSRGDDATNAVGQVIKERALK